MGLRNFLLGGADGLGVSFPSASGLWRKRAAWRKACASFLTAP